jgi:hypothetical protein
MHWPCAEVAHRRVAEKQLAVVSQLFGAFLIGADNENLFRARFEDTRGNERHERSRHSPNAQRVFAIDCLGAKREGLKLFGVEY